MQSHRLPHDGQSAAHCDLHCHVSANLASHTHVLLPRSTWSEQPGSCWLQLPGLTVIADAQVLHLRGRLPDHAVYLLPDTAAAERAPKLVAGSATARQPDVQACRQAPSHHWRGELPAGPVLRLSSCSVADLLRQARRMHACCRNSAAPPWPMAQQNGSAQSVSIKPHGVAALCAAAQARGAAGGPCMTASKPHTSWACRVLACIGVLLLVRAHLPPQSLDPGRMLLPSRRLLLVEVAGGSGSDSNKGRPNWVV